MSNSLSVIIPVYNASNIIDNFYKNIKNISNAEFIFVNDGSTDNSLELLNSLQLIDKRIKVLSQENKGPMHARNAGLKFAQYSYICFVDIDDSIQLDFFKKRELWSKADIIVSSYFSEKYNKIVSKFNVGTYTNMQMLYSVSCHGGWELWGKIYNINIFKNLILPNDRLKAGEDAFIFIQCLMNSNTILVVDDYFYRYSFNDLSISNQKNDTYIYHNYKSCQYVIKYLEKLEVNEVILSNFLILFYSNSFKKNYKSKELFNFKELSQYFRPFKSLNTKISKFKLLFFFFLGFNI